MTSQYTAWNGQQYAGSPPAGWYQAADGRWWAPGTGPDNSGSTSATNPYQSQPANTDLSGSAGSSVPGARKAAIATGSILGAIAALLLTIAVINRPSEQAVVATDPTTAPSQASTEDTVSTEAREFREYLAEEGIPLKPTTTDAELADLGTNTCARASEASDAASWSLVVEREARASVESRELETSDNTGLSEDQLIAVLNGSLLVYCPDEASRLSITR